MHYCYIFPVASAGILGGIVVSILVNTLTANHCVPCASNGSYFALTYNRGFIQLTCSRMKTHSIIQTSGNVVKGSECEHSQISFNHNDTPTSEEYRPSLSLLYYCHKGATTHPERLLRHDLLGAPSQSCTSFPISDKSSRTTSHKSQLGRSRHRSICTADQC